MRPCVTPPLLVRATEFGGVKPLFCIPLVAKDLNGLVSQAQTARQLEADVVEWRADSYDDLSVTSVVQAARELRSVLDDRPIVFTLRAVAEGGVTQISDAIRIQYINAAVRSRLIDLVDIELSSGADVLRRVVETAHENETHVIVSFHDFESTPTAPVLLDKISVMIKQGADVAKIACMPRQPGDVLRLLQVTLTARQAFPTVPLCTTSMARLGTLSRVAGFLYGSDMAFAVGQETSAPGQIPIQEARAITEVLLRHA